MEKGRQPRDAAQRGCLSRSQAEDQELPPPPASPLLAPTFTPRSWFLSPQPGFCLELERGGRGARSHDRFMFQLRLHWPRAQSPVRHTHVLPLEPAEAQPANASPEVR